MKLLFPKNLNNVKLHGKVLCDDKSLSLVWSSSGVSFCAEFGGDIYAELQFVGNADFSDSYTKIAVFIDEGKQPDKIIDMCDRKEYLLALGLPFGTHRITVLKINEKVRGTVKIFGIGFDGRLEAPPELNRLNMEFLGDSLTAGSDLFARGDCDDDFVCAQDSTRSFASVAANILNADYSVIARSGIRTSDWEWLVNLPEYLNERNPDIVVIGLGTNDQSQLEKKLRTPEQQITLVNTMLQNVRKKYGNAKILWVYGLMLTALEDKYDRLISKPVSEFAKLDGNTYFYMLPKNNDGNGGHASPEGHRKAGELLADYISQNLIKFK